MIKAGDAQAVAVWEEYNKSVMTAFPQLSNLDIDNILAYTDYIPPVVAQATVNTVQSAAVSQGPSDFIMNLILVLLVLIFAILTFMLVAVNRTLLVIAKSNGFTPPEKKPKKNQGNQFGKLLLKTNF